VRLRVFTRYSPLSQYHQELVSRERDLSSPRSDWLGLARQAVSSLTGHTTSGVETPVVAVEAPCSALQAGPKLVLSTVAHLFGLEATEETRGDRPLLRQTRHLTQAGEEPEELELLCLGQPRVRVTQGVRDQILDDGAPALRRALARLCAWAPRGSLWEVDGGLVGLRRRDGTFVGMDLMSDGERVRGIAACQVASCAITSAPWRVLLLDNIEHVSTPERTALLAALADLSRDGKLDNVLVAGALDAPPAHGTSLLLEAP